MTLETQIHLNRFKARDYQRSFMDALIKQEKKRFLICWPRRSGKDVCVFNGLIHCALKKVGLYLYLLPTSVQGRRVLFDGITHEGQRILDYIPKELIASIHIQEMKVKLINGSIIIFSGCNDYDKLMGVSVQGIVFSEYALLPNSNAYMYLRPALTATNGFVVFVTTPRGRNHFFSMWNVARESPDWFCSKLTVDDTQHVTYHDIQREIAMGEMSEDKSKQEYWTSFDCGIENSYYGKYIDNLRFNGQIGEVVWEPNHPVYSAFDIGIRDNTTIIMFQVIGQQIRIIDVYEKNREGLEHYIKILMNKPYQWAKHFAPHDMKQMEFGSGMTRWMKAKDLGITFTVVDNIPIVDGIELVRSTLPRCWFNESTTKPLIR